jgi:hypothetical protein
VGDRGVPRAEDRLAPGRRLALLAALPLLLAACGSASFTNVAFRNDLGRPVQLGLCRTDSCRSVAWFVGVDPGAVAVQQVPSDGKQTRRFLVSAPPDAVYGCLAFAFASKRPDVAVAMSTAHGCGSGR